MKVTAHRRLPQLAVWLALVTVLLGCIAMLSRQAPVSVDRRLSIDLRSGVRIVIAAEATTDERGAATLIAETLAHASKVPVESFRIVESSEYQSDRAPAIFVGPRAAPDIRGAKLVGDPVWEAAVGFHVIGAGVVLDSMASDQLRFAASWFLEQCVGARWFIPGPLGIETRPTSQLSLGFGTQRSRPGYISRELGGIANHSGGEWFSANRLFALVSHGHSVASLLGNDIRAAHPELAPLIEGEIFIPPAGNTSWQPHIAHSMAAPAAVRALTREKTRGGFNVVFGLNDSYRFDQSEETLALIRPFRYFRRVPDYSDLLFGFLNRIAEAMPDTLISTYSYYSTENTPSFRVAENVVPFLTADRSLWFDPEFAAQDQKLIKRWTEAGPRLVALYDYLYGRPFFIPRPTPWAVSEPIPFAYRQGVRAYFAEVGPNWGMDGLKTWLAAQLLWNPRLDPVQLQEEYYERFWQEAAEPMRAFFAECDLQWKKQPRPYVWIKYFLDEHQVVLFPPEVRKRLRVHLEHALQLARTSTVQGRVQLALAAFSVTEAFCAHEEARQKLSRLLLTGGASTEELIDHCLSYSLARHTLQSVYRSVKERHPFAVGSELAQPYLRGDPSKKTMAELARRGALPLITAEQWTKLFGSDIPHASYDRWSEELLEDRHWASVRKRDSDHFVATEWFVPGRWSNRSEPWETRSLELLPRAEGGQSIRIAESANETIWQWHAAQPGAVYLASVGVRARVSFGNFTFLLVSFNDADGKLIGFGQTDRLPPGEWNDGRLEVLVRAPPNAKEVSFTLRVMLQMDGDWVEFDSPTLQKNLVP